MPIVGGKIIQLEAQRLESNEIQNMEFNFNVEQLRQEKNLIIIPYTTTINYSPSVARIVVKGEVFYEAEERKCKEILAYFKEKKSLPNDLAEDVLTAVNYSSTAVGTLGAYSIGVNAPLNLPRAKVNEPASRKAG